MIFYQCFWMIAIMISVLYGLLILYLWMGWERIKPFRGQHISHHTRVSVIVPFRNESETIKQCVESLLQQQIDTPFFEIILVDDHSTDGSSKLASRFASENPTVVYLQNVQPGKKAALEFGISKAKGNLMVTTDADCIYPPYWLNTIVGYFETYQPNLIIGPMELKTGSSFFQKFQALEYQSLMGSTAGAAGMGRPVMCNGANLAFKKEMYEHFSNPFKREYTSGDDVFLLHQFKKANTSKIHYLKSPDTVVLTAGANTFKEFLNQRFRWVSKAPGYSDADTIIIASVVFAISAILTSGLALIPFVENILLPLGFFYGIKTTVDFWFLQRVTSFFGKKNLLWYIPFFEIVYAIYVTVSGMSMFFTGRLRK